MDEASNRFGVPATWIERVIRVESGGRTLVDGRPIRSRVGAIGLMQLMPATWAEMRSRLALGTNPDDPRDNIYAGTFYLRQMYDRFGYPALFAAYNAGPARYAAFLAGRSSLPSETVDYLNAVIGGAQIADHAPAGVRAEPLFVARQTVSAGPAGPQLATNRSVLFFIDKTAQ